MEPNTFQSVLPRRVQGALADMAQAYTRKVNETRTAIACARSAAPDFRKFFARRR